MAVLVNTVIIDSQIMKVQL